MLCVDFFTKRKIRLIQNECVLEKNILGFFNIKKGAEKEEIKDENLSDMEKNPKIDE